MGFVLKIRRVRPFLSALMAWLLCCLAMIASAAAPPSKTSPTLDTSLLLERVFQLKSLDGKARLVPEREIAFYKTNAQDLQVAFLAVVTNDWPRGLVPLFAVEKTNRVELRRLPAQGLENPSDPVFFALPPEDELEAIKVAGRWDLSAIRGDGSKAYLAVELAIEREKVAGRFDQNSDYRFAYISGGSFHSNQLELRVEYTMDIITLAANWHEGTLSGKWWKHDGSEKGTWQASRKTDKMNLQGKKVLALYEWRRATDDARHYAVEDEKPGAGWERSNRPLCRVWRAETKGKK